MSSCGFGVSTGNLFTMVMWFQGFHIFVGVVSGELSTPIVFCLTVVSGCPQNVHDTGKAHAQEDAIALRGVF